MKVIDLDGSWVGTLPEQPPVAMAVPGCFDSYSEYKDIATPVCLERTIWVDKSPHCHYRLYFGAVSYYCDVFVNNIAVGKHEGMWDSFMLDVTTALVNGQNTLRVEVTKQGYHESDRFPLRQVLSGFIPDVLCTFGGIWDSVRLLESKNIFLDYHYAQGDASGNFTLCAGLENTDAADQPVTARLELRDEQGVVVSTVSTDFAHGSRELELHGNIKKTCCWSPKSPYIYSYTLTLECAGELLVAENTMGFRSLRADGCKLLLNDCPVYLRGALHWGYYDKDIIPNPAQEVIDDELTKVKSYGLNAVKHCLYIPRESYLSSADRAGVLQWIELPLWLPDPTPELPERIRREYPRIIRQLCGHPSIILTTLGCELDDKVDSDLLCEMYQLLKDRTDTLVKDNSGSGECYGGLSVEYADYFDYHFYADLNHMENLLENFTPSWRNTKPWLFGEFCDSDVLRDLSVVRKAYGLQRLMWEQNDPRANPICLLKPDFYAHHHDYRIQQSGIKDNFAAKYKKSINHSMVHRKVTLEMTRAEPVVSGYNLTSIRDVPLCADGLFNDMGEPKFDLEIFRQSNADVVLAPAWDLTRIWLSADRVQCRERYNFYSGEDYGLHVLLSNYSGDTLHPQGLRYKLLQGGSTVLQGTVGTDACFENGKIGELGVIRFTLPTVDTPATYLLWVTVESGGQTFTNQWPVFVYPQWSPINKVVGVYDCASTMTTLDTLLQTIVIQDGKTLPACDAVVTGRLTPPILDYAEKGGRVVLVQRGEGSLPVRRCSFWREGMLWREFPSFLNRLVDECWMDDLRFYSVTTDTAFDFASFDDKLLSSYSPILRRYDCREWLANDYIARLCYGKGSIMATTLRLEGGAGKQPTFISNNCIGKYLLHQMLTAQ